MSDWLELDAWLDTIKDPVPDVVAQARISGHGVPVEPGGGVWYIRIKSDESPAPVS